MKGEGGHVDLPSNELGLGGSGSKRLDHLVLGGSGAEEEGKHPPLSHQAS